MNPTQRTRDFVRTVAALRFENTFNPYAHTCAEYDLPDAATRRRANLRAALDAAMKRDTHSLWIGRDLGHRGGRRTGLAFTDETHLELHAELMGTRQLVRATRGPAMSERTATTIWRMLASIQRPIFLWNVFPLHPHTPDEQLSNRSHTPAERRGCTPVLESLLNMLRPRLVIAVGRDAQHALADINVTAVPVRHPSYGGQSEFIRGLNAIYGLSDKRDDEAQPQLI